MVKVNFLSDSGKVLANSERSVSFLSFLVLSSCTLHTIKSSLDNFVGFFEGFYNWGTYIWGGISRGLYLGGLYLGKGGVITGVTKCVLKCVSS